MTVRQVKSADQFLYRYVVSQPILYCIVLSDQFQYVVSQSILYCIVMHCIVSGLHSCRSSLYLLLISGSRNVLTSSCCLSLPLPFMVSPLLDCYQSVPFTCLLFCYSSLSDVRLCKGSVCAGQFAITDIC